MCEFSAWFLLHFLEFVTQRDLTVEYMRLLLGSDLFFPWFWDYWSWVKMGKRLKEVVTKELLVVSKF